MTQKRVLPLGPPHTLRLMITNGCSLRCQYCFNEGYPWVSDAHPVDQGTLVCITRAIVSAFAISKLRITGGEPLGSDYLLDAIETLVRTLPEVSIGLTTNGTSTERIARLVTLQGSRPIDISISLPTMDPARFAQVTGVDALESVLESVSRASSHRLGHLKVNCVFISEYADQDAAPVIEYAASLNVPVKLLCLNRNPHNGASLDRAGILCYDFEQLGFFVKSLGYAEAQRSDDRILCHRRGHILEAVACCEWDPVEYYRKFRSIRLYHDGRIAVTGTFDGVCRQLNGADPVSGVAGMLESLDTVSREVYQQGAHACL